MAAGNRGMRLKLSEHHGCTARRLQPTSCPKKEVPWKRCEDYPYFMRDAELASIRLEKHGTWRPGGI